MKFKLFHFALLLSNFYLPAQSTVQWSDSIVVDSTPMPISTPQITLLPGGTPLVIWGVNGDFVNYTSQIWCSRFEHGAFTTPIGAVQSPAEPLLYGFGGYDVALSDSQVFVVFEQSQSQQGIFLSRSYDGGLTFGSPSSVQGTVAGGYSILAAVTVDGTSNPVVGYIHHINGAATYQICRSPDGGDNFDEPVTGNAPAPGGTVCECCTSDLLASGDSVWMVFRNNNQNLRDIWVSRSTDLAATFDTATDVDGTDWHLDVCPISGPRMARSGDSLITVWMSGASGTARVYVSTLHAGTMQMGQQLAFPTPSDPQTAQSQAAVAAVGDTVGVVFVEKSKELVFHFSTNGATGLANQSTRFAIPDHTLQLPSLAFRDGIFHLAYVDATSGQVLYRQGALTHNSPANEPTGGASLGISVFPNPVAPGSSLTVKMDLKRAGELNFEFTDATGKAVRAFSFSEKTIGNQIFNLQTMGAPAGVYFLTARLGGEILAAEKIILK